MPDSFRLSPPAPLQLRYAILRHEGVPEPHFDLLFETEPGSPLAAWRSPAWPIESRIVLVRLPDHRREYLTYEGPISGNRGHVHRVEGGFCRIESRSDDRWEIVLKDYGGMRRLRIVREGTPQDRWVAVPGDAP